MIGGRAFGRSKSESTLVLMHFDGNLVEEYGNYVSGTPAFDTGKFGQALNLNGNVIRFNIDREPMDMALSGSSFTFEFFFKCTYSVPGIINFGNLRFDFYLAQTAINVIFGPGSSVVLVYDYCNWSAFRHFAVVRSGAEFKLFYEGQLVHTIYSNWVYAGSSLNGGSGITGRDNFIDELRISNFARYNTNFPVPTAPFVVD